MPQIIEILRILFESKNSHKFAEFIKDPINLSQQILNSLFNPTKSLFSTQSYRQNSLNLILALIPIFNKEFLRNLMLNLNKMHLSGNWRSSLENDWSLHSNVEIRAKNYIGLRNLGATCYMNSSLQQLFMIPLFRYKIMETKLNDQENWLAKFQLIFANLMWSKKATCNPEIFTQLFKMYGQNINVYVQTDVDEFLTNLLDQIESSLKGTNNENLINEIFKLTFANEIICKDCPHKSESHENAISLILSVKNKKNIYESLNSFIQSEILEGDNAYYCEKCDKKVTAHKRQIIKKLPNILTVILKRFEFNIESETRIKVNDNCEFPLELNMEEYTQETQNLKDLKKDLENGKIEEENLKEEQKRILNRKFPKEYYQYKLKGIIVHSGGVDHGHYYSYIKDNENNSWFEFNDTKVCDFNTKDIPEETYGGVEIQYSEKGKKEELVDKKRNAYVLLYERISYLDSQKIEKLISGEENIENAEMSMGNYMEKYRKENYFSENELFKIVEKDNKKFKLSQYIFNQDYLSFIENIYKNIKINEDSEFCELNLYEFMEKIDLFEQKFILTYLFTVLIRAKNNENIPEITKIIFKMLEKNVKFSQLIIFSLCSDIDIIREILIWGQNENSKKWILEIIKYAIKIVSKYEKENIGKYADCIKDFKKFCEISYCKFNENPNKLNYVEMQRNVKIPSLVILISQIIGLLPDCNKENCIYLCELLTNFAKLDPSFIKILLESNIIGILFEFLHFNPATCIQNIEKSILHLSLDPKIPLISIYQPLEKIPQIPPEKSSQNKPNSQNYISLFELLHILIKSCNLPKFLRKNDQFNYQILEIEENYLISLKDYKILDSLCEITDNSKGAITFFAKIISYLSFNNEEFVSGIFKYLISRISTEECNKLPKFFRILFFFLQNQDKFTSKIDVFIKMFYNIFKKNIKFYRITEEFIDFFIKMYRNNFMFYRTICKEIPENFLLIDSMKNWLIKNPYPARNFDVNFFFLKL